jgi:hypothetical protein
MPRNVRGYGNDNAYSSPPSSWIFTPWGYINARDAPYNATGDGTTDDTNAIQSALNDAGSNGGGIVFLPEGNYYIGSNLVIPAATVLKGVASHVMRDWGDPSVPKVIGTTLLVVADAGNADGTPFILLSGDNAGVDGLQIFYPQQDPSGNPPTSYPWTIQGGTTGVSTENIFVRNVLLVNPWMGIDFSSNECPRKSSSNSPSSCSFCSFCSSCSSCSSSSSCSSLLRRLLLFLDSFTLTFTSTFTFTFTSTFHPPSHFLSSQFVGHWIENVYGQPLQVGIAVDQCYDIGRY